MTGAMKSNGFNQTELGEVLDFFNGKAIKPGGDGEYPAYGSNGLIGRSPGYTHEDGIIIGRVGAYCGSIAYCADKFWASDNTIVAKPKQPTACIRYFSYLLRDLKLNKYAGGAAQPLVTHTVLKRVPALVAQPELQARISALLSAYDDLIENNTRRKQVLERMAQALYREWFVHFRFPGHAQVPRVPSPLGPIPQGWSVRRLDEVASVNSSTIRRGDEPESILYVDISSVGTGRIEKIEPMAFADAPGRARRIVRHGDTIWSCVRPNRKSFSLILDPPADLIVSTGFAVLTPAKVPYSFLHQAVTTDDFVGYLTNHATGAAYPAVTAKDFEAAQILVPNESVLQQFHEHCEPLLLLRESLMRKSTTLRRTRDLLLPKLISGALDVSRLDLETA